MKIQISMSRAIAVSQAKDGPDADKLVELLRNDLKELRSNFSEHSDMRESFLRDRRRLMDELKKLDRGYNRRLDAMYDKLEDFCEDLLDLDERLVAAGHKSMIDKDTRSLMLLWINDHVDRAEDLVRTLHA